MHFINSWNTLIPQILLLPRLSWESALSKKHQTTCRIRSQSSEMSKRHLRFLSWKIWFTILFWFWKERGNLKLLFQGLLENPPAKIPRQKACFFACMSTNVFICNSGWVVISFYYKHTYAYFISNDSVHALLI